MSELDKLLSPLGFKDNPTPEPNTLMTVPPASQEDKVLDSVKLLSLPDDKPESEIMSFEPTSPEEVGVSFGMSLNPVDPITTPAEKPRALSFLETPTFSNSKRRNSLLLFVDDPDYGDDIKNQFIKSYIKNLVQEGSFGEGKRPEDERFRSERRKSYKDLALARYHKEIKEPSTRQWGEGFRTKTSQDYLDEIYEDETVAGAVLPYDTKKEYITRLFQEEVAKSNLTAKQKEFAFKELNLQLSEEEARDSASTPENLLEEFIFNTSKIKSGESAVGDTYKIVGGLSNFPSGLLGLVVSSAAAPFMEDKYYLKDERPISPLANYLKSRSLASELISWRSSGQKDGQDPEFVMQDVMSGGGLDGNDLFLKKATELSLRSRKITDGEGVLSVPFNSTADVIRSMNNIADDEYILKEKIADLLLKDPKYSEFTNPTGPTIYSEGKKPDLSKQVRESKKFKSEVNRLFDLFSAVHLGDPEVYELLNSYEKKYADVFKSYYPEETLSSEAAETIKNAAYYIFEAGPLDSAVKPLYVNDLKEMLTVLPENQRQDAFKVLSGIGLVPAAFTGGLPEAVKNRRNLFNSIAVRYAQKKEDQSFAILASEGGIGPRWRGDYLQGTPKQIEKKKKMLHQFASKVSLLETISNNPDFQNTVASFYGNVGTGVSELPYQTLLSVGAISSLLGHNFGETLSDIGLDVDPEEFEKQALEKYEADPVMVFFDIAGVMSLAGHAGRAGIVRGASIKDAFGATTSKSKGNLFTASGIKDLFDNYREAKKTNSQILEETLKSPDETVINKSQEELNIEFDEFTEMNARVMVSPDHTIGQYQKSLNDVQRKIAEEKAKPKPEQNSAVLESLSYQENSLQKILETRTKFRRGELTGTVIVDETAPLDDSVQVKVGDVTDQSVKSVEESFLSQNLTDEQISQMGTRERKQFLVDEVEGQLNAIDDLYKSNPKQAAEDALYGKSVAEKIAKGFYITDFTTKSGGMMMFKALVQSGIDDFRVWKYVADTIDSKYLDVTNRQLARGIAGTRDILYTRGIKARSKVARSLYDETPASVISRETKKDPRIVKDEFESLAIADELAASGETNPAAYIGLNLTNEQIAGFIDDARARKITARSVEKTQDYFNDAEYNPSFLPDDGPRPPRGESFDSGPVSGAFTEPTGRVETSPLPQEIGVTDAMPFGQRVSRAATKTVFGQEGLNLLNQYRKSGQKRFIAQLATESLIRPYAALNIPGWVKNLREELLMYAFTTKNPSAGVMSVLDFFSTSSEILGQKQFYELRLADGRKNYDARVLEESFPQRDSFEITPEHIKRTFNKAEIENDKGTLRTFDRTELHQASSVLHRMSDAEIIDTRTGKSYKVTDFIERTVEAKKLFEQITSRLFSETTDAGRQVYSKVSDLIESIKSRIDSGDTRVSVTDIFPDIDKYKKTFETLFEKRKTQSLTPEEVVDFETAAVVVKTYESFTAKDVLFNTSDIRYTPKIPISELDSFQKSITILANEFVKPRRDVIFDLVDQIVTGSDTARLMFKNNGLKTIVVKTDSSGTNTVVAKFPQTQKGFFDATTYVKKSGEGFSLRSIDDLKQEAYTRERKGPQAPKVKRAFERKGTDILENMSNYISDYFDKKKTADFVEAQLSTADIGPGVTQLNQHRIAENMLAIFDGGFDLLKESGYDPIIAIQKAIKLTTKEQKKILGRVLSNSERNFMQRITEKRFTPNELLEMYSDYQLSFMETASDLLNTVHQLKLQTYLRSKGQILNQSEFNALPKGTQRQFIEVDNVVAKGELVFPSTMSGAFINRRVATYFQRQIGLQRAIKMANPLQRILGSAQQLSKAGLLMDFINSSIAVNLFAGLFVQAPYHGKLPVNPAYYKRTRDLVKGASEGKQISDQRLLRIVKTHIASDTSVKRDVIYTKGQSIFDDFIVDLNEHAGTTKTIQLMNQIDASNQTSVFKKLVSALRLEGMEAKLNKFLDRLKLEDLDEPITTDLTKLQKARKLYSDFNDAFFKVYQYPDLIQKIAYQWQLEEAGYSPSYAYQQSMTKFIDYVDLAPYLNFLRYGGSTAAGSFFSIITSDFLTFAASQVSNHFDAVTNNPLRTYIFAHLARTNDFALEELLKMKMSIHEIRSKSGDPTQQFLPGYVVDKATGKEYTDSGDFVGGPATYKGSRMTGVPAPAFGLSAFGIPFGLLPLIPTDPEQTMRPLPQNIEDITSADMVKSFSNYFTNSLGGQGQQATEELNKRPSESKLLREKEGTLIKEGDIVGEETNYRPTGTVENIVRIFGSRYIPRVLRTMASIAEGSRYKSQIIGEFFGISAKPLDLASIPTFRLYPFMKEKDLKRTYKTLIDKQSRGKKINLEKLEETFNLLQKIKNEAKKEKRKIYEAEIDAFLYNQFELLGKVLEGKMEKKDIDDYFFQMPRPR